MQKRAQWGAVQVCVALVCALGAAFSGDMLSRYTGQSHHQSRHARGPHHRGTRSAGRSLQGDHAHEIELVRDVEGAPQTEAGQPAVVAERIRVAPTLLFLEIVAASPVADPPGAIAPTRSSRGPPSFS